MDSGLCSAGRLNSPHRAFACSAVRSKNKDDAEEQDKMLQLKNEVKDLREALEEKEVSGPFMCFPGPAAHPKSFIHRVCVSGITDVTLRAFKQITN